MADFLNAADHLDPGVGIAIGILIGAAIALGWHAICAWADHLVDPHFDEALDLANERDGGVL